jgi:hypothetical protein
MSDGRPAAYAGRGQDDISIPGQAIAGFVRAPHAHAIVERINAAAARRMPGVIAVLTGGDYLADGLKGALQCANPADATDIKVRAFAPEKRPELEELQFLFAHDRVRYPGEAIAMVVAETLFQARDATRGARSRIRVVAGRHQSARDERRRDDRRHQFHLSRLFQRGPPSCGGGTGSGLCRDFALFRLPKAHDLSRTERDRAPNEHPRRREISHRGSTCSGGLSRR